MVLVYVAFPIASNAISDTTRHVDSIWFFMEPGAAVPICNSLSNTYGIGSAINNISDMDITVIESNRLGMISVGTVVAAHSLVNLHEQVRANVGDVITLTATVSWPGIRYTGIYYLTAGSSTQSTTITIDGACPSTPAPAAPVSRVAVSATPTATPGPTPSPTPTLTATPTKKPSSTPRLTSTPRPADQLAGDSIYAALLTLLVAAPVALYFLRPVIARLLRARKSPPRA